MAEATAMSLTVERRMKTAKDSNRSGLLAEIAPALSTNTVPDCCQLGQEQLTSLLGVEGEPCLPISHLYALVLAQCLRSTECKNDRLRTQQMIPKVG